MGTGSRRVTTRPLKKETASKQSPNNRWKIAKWHRMHLNGSESYIIYTGLIVAFELWPLLSFARLSFEKVYLFRGLVPWYCTVYIYIMKLMKLAHPVRPWKLSPGNLRLRNGIKISQPFAASLSFHIVSIRLFFCSLKGMAPNSSQRIGYPKLPWTKSAPIADITWNTHWLEVMGIEPYKNIDLNHNRLNNYKQLTYINTYDTVIKQPLYIYIYI